MNMPVEAFSFVPELVGRQPLTILLGKTKGKGSIRYMAKKRAWGCPRKPLTEYSRRSRTTSAEANKRVLTQEKFRETVRCATSVPQDAYLNEERVAVVNGCSGHENQPQPLHKWPILRVSRGDSVDR
jgi:hypothetical protein